MGLYMKKIKAAEKRKRGCDYCADVIGRWKCPYEECPYKELDKYSTYGQYLKSKDSIVFGLEIWNRAPRKIRETQ